MTSILCSTAADRRITKASCASRAFCFNHLKSTAGLFTVSTCRVRIIRAIVIQSDDPLVSNPGPKCMTTRTNISEEPHLRLDRYVPGLLLWLSNKLAGSASQVYRRQFGINIVEWRILSYLAVYETGTGAQMSQLMGGDKAGHSRGAAALQRKKLIKSQQGSGRNLEFMLTTKGKAMHDRVIHLALARQDALLTGLNKSQIDDLITYLNILLRNLAAVEAIDATKY